MALLKRKSFIFFFSFHLFILQIYVLYFYSNRSRLGCQIYMTKEFDGLRVKVPPAVNDVRLR